MCNNSKLDIAKMNAYIKFCENVSSSSQDIERKQNFSINQALKGHNSGTNVQKIIRNNPKVDLAKVNAYIKFGEILPLGSQDIERKRNFSGNQGP